MWVLSTAALRATPPPAAASQSQPGRSSDTSACVVVKTQHLSRILIIILAIQK